MRKSCLVLVGVVALVGGTWLVRDWASAQGPVPTAGAEDQRVQDPSSWHRVVYAGMEFTVYTGPGHAMFTNRVQVPAAKPAGTLPSGAPAAPAYPAPRTR
jgi:hypothetical protein